MFSAHSLRMFLRSGKIPFLCILSSALVAAALVPEAPAAEKLVHTFALPPGELTLSTLPGENGETYDFIEFEGCDFLHAPGAPMVPARIVRLALPAGYEIDSIQATARGERKLEGRYRLFPTQQPRPLSRPGPEAFTKPDETIYGQNRYFPCENAGLIGQGSLSGYGIAEVKVYPLKWNPRSGEVLLSDIEISLTLKPSARACKVQQRTRQAESTFRRAVGNLVDNPEQVPEQAAANITIGASSRGDVVEYLVITGSGLVTSFQPLADWRWETGHPAEIVTTTWVYANYGVAGDDNPTRIRKCIKDYWQNKGLVYVLLAGDSGIVPERRAFVTGNDNGNKIPCDLYYADLDGTWDGDQDGIFGEYPEDGIDMYCDVYLGRASVDNTTQADRFVDKVLQYEAAPSMPPLLTDYVTTAYFMGSELDAIADGKVLKNKIDNESMPDQFDPITKHYQSNGNLTVSGAIAEISKGYNYINHSGHGDNAVLQAGTGYIQSTQLAGVTNGPRYSIFYSHSCYSLNFVWLAGDCIGEKFLNASGGGGFYVGNSRYGWHAVPFEGSLSPKLDREFFKSIFDPAEYYYPLGQVHAEAKHKRVGAAKSQTYERYCNYELNLLGDPAMPVWKDTPGNPTVTCPSSLPVGPSTFQVNVKSAGGLWVEGARVCIRKAGEIYLAGETDFFGNITFNPSPATPGTLEVTVIAGDHFPYEATAAVVGGGLQADTNTLSESTGGVVNFTLQAGPTNANRNYLMLGSISGTLPGTPLPGGMATLPLNWDLLTNLVISLLNTPIFSNFMGVLDGSGSGAAKYDTLGPLPPGLVGASLYFAYALNNPWDFASNAVAIEIVP